jgi:MOSC domain-containing protein YiiM
MMEEGKIIALHLCEEHRQPMTSVQEATAVSDTGLEGDRHAIKGNARQVLLMDKETLDELGLTPGIIKENVTVEGLDFSAISEGQVFEVGDGVTLEVTGPCLPCGRMDEIRPGLRENLEGRRGILVKVVNGGTIRVGEPVKVVQSIPTG